MAGLWLIFAQTVTIAVAVLFVVSTFRPEWLPGRALPGAALQQLSSSSVADSAAARATSYHDAVRRAAPSVVNIFSSKEIRSPKHPLLNDPIFRRFFAAQLPYEPQHPPTLASALLVTPSRY